ncbi:MAG: hypothetical protein KA354_09735 [Phycisphaerae bacterium]|nr:hypothetical protein [Phycisphaerae bacterium]
MSGQGRCCGGRCRAPMSTEMSRREFMEKLTAGVAALAVAEEYTRAENLMEKSLALPAKLTGSRTYPLTPARVYKGKNLEAVAMPIGGIGTGSIWLNGQGELGVWQIFNNFTEHRIPDSFFAVRARGKDGKVITRVLQTTEDGSLKPVESLEYEGGYPIARLTFRDRALPIEVLLEAANPMIPLDAANSSIPCAIFRLIAKNTGQDAVETAFFAAMQNAVGGGGDGGIRGVKYGKYGGNRNRVVRDRGLVSVAMDKSADPVASGPVKVRDAKGLEVAGQEMLWLTGASSLTRQITEPIARIASDGGIVLVDGVSSDFFDNLAKLRAAASDFASVATVFEDFEKDTYEGWTVNGAAFGSAPSRGTEANQQRVSGFTGKRLINTYLGGDATQGTATSKPFKIERRYIGFLIGGGHHPKETCINLLVDKKVVRTATGKNDETLDAAGWDVGDLKGKEAVIEVVDRRSDAWGHINVDRIIFSDVPPEALLSEASAAAVVAKAIGVTFKGAEDATLAAGTGAVPTRDAPDTLQAPAAEWRVSGYTRLGGCTVERGYRVLTTTPGGDPLVIEGPLGKGRIILALAPRLPWSFGSALLAAARPEPLKAGERMVPGDTGWGTMALTAFDPTAAALPAWRYGEELTTFMGNPAKVADKEAVSKAGETINAALGVPFTLQAGESRTVTFAITWHFPNVRRFQHAGNLYTRRWADASAVAGYLATNLDALWERTRLYHQTVYQSNLPEEFIDAMTSQVAILRGPTCFWSEDGYFGGFEGSYGCCPLNCTHVWNYAQTHARLFPAVGQNMRVSNFVTFLHANGQTSHREHGPHDAFIDGHCACIEAALREYQLSPDRKFLDQVWPGVKKAVDWIVQAIDKNKEGTPHGHQWNTYDTAVSGENTFIGSQYLGALAAGEKLALIMNDTASAERWRLVREAGMKTQNEKLWNGEYYIQTPEAKPAHDYNTGCHADQLLGQWWAHMLGLGYLFPVDRVKSALAAVAKYNFREKLEGFKQIPRRYVPDDEGGLIICTWPKGGRPDPFILYADEVWTGIEYAAAGAMVYEGLIDDARKIVRMARSRYDGRRRDGLNSGPGGNPYNELECGKFYARAMSSWSLLIASQGLVLEGPKGILGFKPRWQPEDHRSFYTAPEGWGLFMQQRKDKEQTARIEVRHGRLKVSELVFAVPDKAPVKATVTAAGQAIAAEVQQTETDVRLVLEHELAVTEGSAIEVTLRQA